jgi:uncharacterized UBP type Zn finger protein
MQEKINIIVLCVRVSKMLLEKLPCVICLRFGCYFIQTKGINKVLNFQLMRFVYDMKTLKKKKLRTNVRFPLVLNMKDFLNDNNEPNEYNLSAVLIHKGTSAYGGHYIAHIRDEM